MFFVLCVSGSYYPIYYPVGLNHRVFTLTIVLLLMIESSSANLGNITFFTYCLEIQPPSLCLLLRIEMSPHLTVGGYLMIYTLSA